MLKSAALLMVGMIGLTVPAAAEDVRQAIEQVNAQFMEAFKAGDAATIASLYTDTAKMPPTPPRSLATTRFRTSGRAGSMGASRI